VNAFSGGTPRKRSRPNLYELLPAIYRRRDAEVYAIEQRQLSAVGHQDVEESVAATRVAPLKALFAILQGPFDSLERDVAALYDDWFVETCSPEMLALIAEPLAIRELDTLIRGRADLRAVVANIVDYRRRKGTAGALAEFAADATGWTVYVSESLQRVATAARVDGEAVPRQGYADVRNRPPGAHASSTRSRFADLADPGGERAARIDVWRTKAACVAGVEPGRPDPAARPRRTFNPVGDDEALMRPAGGEEQGVDPGCARPLTRTEARADLAAHGHIAGIEVRELRWLTEHTPPLEIADLSGWSRPERTGADPRTVYVDPELGRLLAPEDGGMYTVDYWMATHEGIGAAPRSAPWPGSFDRTLLVSPVRTPEGARRFRRLEAQLLSRMLQLDQAAFERHRGLVDFIDFNHFAAQWAFIQERYTHERSVPDAGELLSRWPTFPVSPNSLPVAWLIAQLSAQTPEAAGGEGQAFERFATLAQALNEAGHAHGSVRIVLGTSETQASPNGWVFRPGRALSALSIESAPGVCPVLHGSLFLLPYAAAIPVRLVGVTVRGRIVCAQGAELTVERATLRPVTDERGTWSLEDAAHTQSATRARRIEVRNSYLGGARLSDATDLVVEDSVVTDPIAPLDSGPDARGPFLIAQRATFLGEVDAYQLIADDVLFDQPVRVKLDQRGYLRYCALRTDEKLPQRYKCVVTDRQLVASKRYGRTRFARFRTDAPQQVLEGSSDGSEIGAYGPYGETLRRANLDIVMDEFLPEGVSHRVNYRS